MNAVRPENERGLEVLAQLDGGLMNDAACFFGGGTAVSLRCDEFRVSRDVDLLCSSREGYRLLRQRVFVAGAAGLFSGAVRLAREPRVDRYGIRFVVATGVAGLDFVKVEIVSEGRLDLRGTRDTTLPIARLTDADLVACKLLANEDRFLDDGSAARDVIDLLMLEHTLGELPVAGWDKARAAYGDTVETAFLRATERLATRPTERRRCFDVLGVSDAARAILEARLATVEP